MTDDHEEYMENIGLQEDDEGLLYSAFHPWEQYRTGSATLTFNIKYLDRILEALSTHDCCWTPTHAGTTIVGKEAYLIFHWDDLLSTRDADWIWDGFETDGLIGELKRIPVEDFLLHFTTYISDREGCTWEIECGCAPRCDGVVIRQRSSRKVPGIHRALLTYTVWVDSDQFRSQQPNLKWDLELENGIALTCDPEPDVGVYALTSIKRGGIDTDDPGDRGSTILTIQTIVPYDTVEEFDCLSTLCFKVMKDAIDRCGFKRTEPDMRSSEELE